MFFATFIGHQGWLLGTEQTRLLIDPLLTEDFGHAGVVGKVFPPRELDLSAFPPVNAVLLTHEHEDHFDIPSLHRLDRALPILLSARSSSAARQILAEMGFEVRLVKGGEVLELGDLELRLFSVDHVTQSVRDEWDVLQYLVRDSRGDGSFFSGVDGPVSQATHKALREVLPRPHIWGHTNNATDWSMLAAGRFRETRAPVSTMTCASAVINELVAMDFAWRKPAVNLFCGGGFSLSGDRAALNERLFPVDSAVASAALAAVMPDTLCRAPAPGETVTFVEGKLSSHQLATTFLTAAPRATWPARGYRESAEVLERYAPASGRTDLSEEELWELMVSLRELAQHLYGRDGFKGLFSVSEAELEGRKAALALVLLADADGSSYVLEYQPEACAFAPVDSDDPVAEYVTGIECWGTDLLGLFRGEFGPTSIVFGRGRSWSFSPEFLKSSFDLGTLLWDFFHPLRRPDSFLRLYRRLLTREHESVPRVRAAPKVRLQSR